MLQCTFTISLTIPTDFLIKLLNYANNGVTIFTFRYMCINMVPVTYSIFILKLPIQKKYVKNKRKYSNSKCILLLGKTYVKAVKISFFGDENYP